MHLLHAMQSNNNVSTRIVDGVRIKKNMYMQKPKFHGFLGQISSEVADMKVNVL